MVLFLYYLKPLLFCLLLIAASAVDIKRREIPDGISLCITGLALLGLCPENLLGILAALPFLIAALNGGMGGGDVKLVASCGLVVGLPGALFESILGLIILLLYSLVHRIRGCLFHGKASAAFPMAPFFIRWIHDILFTWTGRNSKVKRCTVFVWGIPALFLTLWLCKRHRKPYTGWKEGTGGIGRWAVYKRIHISFCMSRKRLMGYLRLG